MNIVIPMAGASSRFINAGYPPKYTLELRPGFTLFDAAFMSFEGYFTRNSNFIIITNSPEASMFAESRIKKISERLDEGMMIKYAIYTLDGITRGQAETVYTVLSNICDKKIKVHRWILGEYDDLYIPINSEPYGELAIFNIDTVRHLLKDDISLTRGFKYAPGVIDVFYDPDADEKKWSFCSGRLPDNTKTFTPIFVGTVAEKKRVGPYCSTGLYFFRNISTFLSIYERAKEGTTDPTDPDAPPYNYYIAPLYNYIKDAILMRCHPDDVEFAGVPEDYEKLKIKYQKEVVE